MATVERTINLNRFDFIACAIMLGCDFAPSGIKGVGQVLALKVLNAWKLTKRHPVHQLAKLKSSQTRVRSKEDEKLKKKLLESDVDILLVANEFQVRYCDRFMKECIEIKFKPSLNNLSKVLTQRLDWPLGTSDSVRKLTVNAERPYFEPFLR